MLHLGQADGSAARARRYLHPWALLGRSTHAPGQTDKAIKDRNVDYFCVGPVYATSTKPDYEPVGLDLVRYAARKAPVAVVKSKPWFAIGGISLDNLDAVIEAGARRVCVVRAITEASDPQAAADRLSSRLRAAWKADPAMERYVFQALSEPGSQR
jgi:thiamine-phosphate pyrophosphorylase